MESTTKRSAVSSVVFRRCVDEEDRIGVDLGISEGRLMFGNHLQKLDMVSNVGYSANIIVNWTKLPPRTRNEISRAFQ